jgi:hypothetical protein
MNYQIKATQTITKYFAIEAESEGEALEVAQAMAEEGGIQFDDEPFLKMEVAINIL